MRFIYKVNTENHEQCVLLLVGQPFPQSVESIKLLRHAPEQNSTDM